jgi:hypothetical protein
MKAVADSTVSTMQSRAYCDDCNTYHDPDDLTQTWRAKDEPACPQCRSAIPDEYRP